jgi:hypothetical protein
LEKHSSPRQSKIRISPPALPGKVMTIDHEYIKALSKKLRRPPKTLVAMGPNLGAGAEHPLGQEPK